MPVGNIAGAVATQKEWVRGQIEKLSLSSSVLWKEIGLNTQIKPVSNRPVRIPMQPNWSGKFRVGNFDGPSLGRGSGPQTIPGTLSCVAYVQASEWTAAAEYTTDSDAKAIQDYTSLLQSQKSMTMGAYMDALLQTDGTNTLDTVVSVSGTTITVNNPNQFQTNQDVDVWSALADQGGSFRGSFTVAGVDAINSQIVSTGALPAGTTAGDLMLVSGAPAVTGSGLQGLRSYNVAGNTGTYLGIQKSAYPGVFNVPNFNNPGTLTPALVRAIDSAMQLSIGVQKADEADLTAHCNVDMISAWENVALNVQRVDVPEIRGDSQPDMLKRKRPTTIGGRRVIVNERARPGYIDWIALKHWFSIQSKALSPYDVNGQVIFPTYGADGGIGTSYLTYLVIWLNFASVQPRLNAYLSGVTIPKFYFGR